MTVTEFLRADAWHQNGSGPRYVQLRNRIEDAIAQGVLTANAPLPSERDIAGLTGLSRVTVRKAIQDLVARGIVVQRQGSGSFVTDATRVEQSLSQLTSFTEDMAQRGLSTEAKWLERGLFLPTAAEVAALALPADGSVARIARLRLAEGRPMAIERASLPPDILPNPVLVERSLYAVLAQDGNRPVRALQKISALNLTEEDADLLGVAPGVAGLNIARTSYLASGRVVEFTRSVYRGDAYDFVAELRLS